MIKFISAIDESIVQAVNCYLLENILQECTVEIETETGQCFLCGYYDDVETGKKFFQDIKNVFPNIGDIKCQEINNTDWENEYKKYCKPWNFKYIDWVPLWLKDEIKPREGVEPVYIDSSLAFGTGMHETTRLCVNGLEMFYTMYRRTADLCVKKCIDIGCGTGILGISAIKIGLQSSFFIDNDEQAIKVCKENVLNNNVSPDRVGYVCSDLRVGLLGRQGDLVFANISSDVLTDNVEIIVSSVKPGGLLCLSGILIKEMDTVKPIYKNCITNVWDSVLESYAEKGEWGTLIFCRG